MSRKRNPRKDLARKRKRRRKNERRRPRLYDWWDLPYDPPPFGSEF